MSGVVLVVGDVINDVVVEPLESASPNSDTAARIHHTPGGSGANQAAWLAHLRQPVRLAARVGAADAGEHARNLRAAGVEPRLAVDADLPTGTVICVVDGERRSMYTDRGASAHLSSGDLPSSLLDDAVYLHVSGYALLADASREAVLDLVARAAARGIAWSVDPASEAGLRALGPRRFLDVSAGAALCLPNADEAAVLAGVDDQVRAAQVLAASYPVVVVTCGSRGCVLAQRGEPVLEFPAPTIDAVDPTGAGDAFCAGYLAAHIAGAAAVDAARAAVRIGSRCAGRVGGRPTAAR
ncbi:MAG: hypothetical protein DLM56_07935 [Pseudonocardiales bacterium]|nr:MAG: hypothetical protein DLM56_07935 [Pseudonocardiales bacterium]